MTEKWGQGEGKSFRQLKLQTPNSKLQRSSKSQAPRQRACDRYWNLKFGISLELGVWDLVFHYLNTPWLRPGSDFFSCLSHVSRLHSLRSEKAGHHRVVAECEGPEIFE